MTGDAAPGAPRTPLPLEMSAWRQKRYGGPEAVRLETVPVPDPGQGEVLVRVRATGLNAADVKLLRGEPRLLRLMFGLRRPKEPTRGMDVAGEVVAIGAAVDGFAVGDEVMGELPGGGLAEYVAGPAVRLTLRPAGLAPELAAALPLAGGTALQALDLGGVEAGARILVIGASGGVGTFAVQLAALRGAEVWALCGARAEELVAGLGATRTFDYRAVRIDDLPEDSFDAVIDIAGTAPLRALRGLVRRAGTLVLVSGEGGRVLGPMGRILRAGLLSLTPGPRIRPLAAVAKAGLTRELAGLAAAGRLLAVIERTWPLSDAGAALAHIDTGHTLGKVIVLA